MAKNSNMGGMPDYGGNFNMNTMNNTQWKDFSQQPSVMPNATQGVATPQQPSVMPPATQTTNGQQPPARFNSMMNDYAPQRGDFNMPAINTSRPNWNFTANFGGAPFQGLAAGTQTPQQRDLSGFSPNSDFTPPSNFGFMPQQQQPRAAQQPQRNNSDTYDSIMQGFNQPGGNQQQDFNQNAGQTNTPQAGGMPNQAGGYLPELDYIPEATNGMNSVQGTGGFEQNMGRSGMFGNFDATAQANGRGLNEVSTAQAGRQQAEDSMYEQFTSRLDPKFEEQEQQLQIDLRNRGLREGDAAYDAAMANFGREKTDAYQQAKFSSLNNAGAEAERDFGIDSKRRSQMFGEQMGLSQDEITRMGVDLESRAQQFGEQMGMSKDEIERLSADMRRQELIQRRAGADQQLSIQDQQLMLQGDQQMFGQQMGASQFQNQMRQQQISEEMMRRNQSLNELNALLSGSQVQSPQFQGYNQAGNAGGVDYSGAAGQQYGASIDAANIRNAAIGNAINGAGSIAGMFSDERLKTDLVKVGEQNGFNLYTWTWNELMPEAFKRGKKGFGVIAQEVAKVMPTAIIIDNTGFMKVDYQQVLGE